jgi:RecB family endonuclease NucS
MVTFQKKEKHLKPIKNKLSMAEIQLDRYFDSLKQKMKLEGVRMKIPIGSCFTKTRQKSDLLKSKG